MLKKSLVLSKLKTVFRPKVKGAKLIEVYALVGKAGTGKSFRARLVADTHNIPAIIDDGLLIREGKIVAGRSAKEKEHYIAAVKTAMFNEAEHREAMIRALSEAQYPKILLLGTSDRMILRNCLTLGLPEPKQIIRIEEIASREKIEEAIRSRKTKGQHVIPLPVVEVKQAYPKLIAHAIKVWFEHMVHGRHYDKTVVRPGYQQRGDVTISESALTQMILHCVRERVPSAKIQRVRIKHKIDGYDIKMNLSLAYGEQVAHSCGELRDYTIRKIEDFCGITICKLQLHIESVRVDNDRCPRSSQ
ncbi:hypothetical protein DDZ13_12200 [Coraliomargarita sinensis]|uniref:Asp23/Gls24 family envelope stress response protein n=1 Tax=Coraliomargarita sinensis TaxID=2174842 RepID=A0A317ZHI9_9BACT|nr:hypothetical protein [Coraliomargarita sinensis]PXA03448.1 hypothetical protein DDZ13_12200 [Coraliomargarita sinensis]